MREKIERHIDEHEHGEVPPPGHTPTTGREMEQEVDRGLWGPGALGTRSQLIGGAGGLVVGGIVGGVLGLLAGLVLFAGQTTSLVITIVVGVVAGATALGIAGGFVWNRGKQERGDPDV